MYVPQAGGSTIELWLAGWLDGSAPFESVELVTPGADWRGADQTQKKSTKKNIFLYFFFFQSFSSSYTEKKRFLLMAIFSTCTNRLVCV
jgi:hypothetical protein